jgi:hypothetical protein
MASSSAGGQDGQYLKETYKRLQAIEEFLIDFLGGVVPGVLFLGATTFALLPPLYALATKLTPSSGSAHLSLFQAIAKVLEVTKETPTTLWLIVLAGGVLLAYITGHLFYRHDPTPADRSSLRRLLRKSEFRCSKHPLDLHLNWFTNWPSMPSMLKLLCKLTLVKRNKYCKTDLQRLEPDQQRCEECIEREQNRKDELACADLKDCEFPYPFMSDYLEHRGLGHLAKFTRMDHRSKRYYRSKRYMDILKIRLRHYYPDKCGLLIRNEAHVRLASSTWYVSGILCIVGVSGILLGLGSIFFDGVSSWLSSSGAKSLYGLTLTNLVWQTLTILIPALLTPAVLAPLIVLTFSAYSQWMIREFLHYQRLREVVFILETAYTAFRSNLELLIPPYEELRNYGMNFQKKVRSTDGKTALIEEGLPIPQAGNGDESRNLDDPLA